MKRSGCAFIRVGVTPDDIREGVGVTPPPLLIPQDAPFSALSGWTELFPTGAETSAAPHDSGLPHVVDLLCHRLHLRGMWGH